MLNTPPRSTNDLSLFRRVGLRSPNLTTFRHQLQLLKWLIPFGLVVLIVVYELGPSRMIYQSLGFTYHLLIEIVLFGTVGPLLAFVLLELLGRWIDEKETADLQAHLLAQAGEKELKDRQLNDNTLQVLFATGLLLSSIRSDRLDLPPNTITQIETTEQALNESIEQLRSHLLS